MHYSAKIKLVFWDRDGVINIGRPPVEDGASEEQQRAMYILSPDQFELVPTVKEAIAQLKDYGLIQVLVTKQRGIERGLMTIEELANLHKYMEEQLDLRFDDIKVQTRETEQSKDVLMVKAMRKFSVEPDECAIIGDRASDMALGLAAKISVRILVTWQSRRDGLIEDIKLAKKSATHIVETPLQAAELLLKKFIVKLKLC